MTSAPTTECRWCGKPLAPKTVLFAGRRYSMGFEPCGCIGAREERKRKADSAAKADAEKRRRKIDAAMAQAGILPRYRNGVHVKAAGIADQMQAGRWAYLWGDVGTGKTTCAMAVTAELVRRGQKPRIAPMSQILHEVQRSFDEGGDPMRGYERAPFLLLDDLGKESPTPFALERMFSLIDYRYSRMLPTAVTTQYKPGDLINRLASKGDFDTAQAIVSRLREDAVVERFGGGDRRLG